MVKGYQKLRKCLTKTMMKTNEQKELGVNQLSGEKKTSKSNITNIHIQSKEDLSMKYKYLLLKGLFQEKKKCSWKLKKKKVMSEMKKPSRSVGR